MPDQPDTSADPLWVDALDILRRHVATERTYASYWKFSIDRQIEERAVAAHLLAYLEAFEGWLDAKVESSERDPPDCHGVDATGRRFGIEVTELVHQDTVAAHARRSSALAKGRPIPDDAAEPWKVAGWTVQTLRVKLTEIVADKDRVAPNGPFVPYLVAIFTDETMVTRALVEEALNDLTITARYIDGAYLLLSYDPGADEFPNRTPVIRLPVIRL